MNEKETLEYIDKLQMLGSVPGLESIQNLCEKLGNPQDKLTFIHIAGTNGKGSTSAYISYILMAAGYRVGRYNSPVIRTYREKIAVGRQMITKEALSRLMTQIRDACEQLVAEGKTHPTLFEVETVLGFLYFVEKKTDIVILECGMGGRQDATNLIKAPLLCVLASISMDHMAFLGDTLAKIATEKAGIIKPGSEVVSAQQMEQAQRVIEKTCLEQGARLTFVDTARMSQVKRNLDGQSFVYEKGDTRLSIEIPLLGSFQLENALLALEAVLCLKEKGYRITDRCILKGFSQTVWPGRFQILARNPLFIVDGAHNEDAARKLAHTLQFHFTNRKIIYIMGILKDKEYEKIIALTAPFASQIITVSTPNNPRAMDALWLAKEVAKVNPKVTAADSIEEAVEMSRLLADKDSVILAFGSLSYLGAIMDILEK